MNPDLLQPPGTQLADGVRVQDGTWLVGGVFPGTRWEFTNAPGSPIVDGWQSLVVSELDPVSTWEAYAGQLGVADVAPPEKACVVRRPVPEPQPIDEANAPYGSGPPNFPFERFLTAEPLEGEQVVWCTVRVSEARDLEFGKPPPPGPISPSFEMVLASGLQRCPSPNLESDHCEPRPVSHLFVRVPGAGVPPEPRDVYVGTSGIAFQPNGTSLPPPPGEIRIPDPDLPNAPLPQVGERFDGGIDYYLDDTFVVPAGGRLAAGPALVQDCNSGLVAVLEVGGDPRTAARTVSGTASQDDVTGLPTDSGEIALAYVSDAGGFHLLATAIPAAAPNRSLVLVTECGD